MYEGGIRVPGIIEWPEKIKNQRVTEYPAGAVDIFPTIFEIAGLSNSVFLTPQDGKSLLPVIQNEIGSRDKPLVFSSRGRMALIDNEWKIISRPGEHGRKLELFNLSKDQSESNNLFRPKHPQLIRLRGALVEFRQSIDNSVRGKDYGEGRVLSQPPRMFWTEVEEYKKYFSNWKNRPEYSSRLRNK